MAVFQQQGAQACSSSSPTSTICCFSGASYHTTSPPLAWHACLASSSVLFTSRTIQHATDWLSQKKVVLKRGAPVMEAHGREQVT